jgi:2-polyprenyl-6-methoxyphenol hydroxylase-like FAD-dependent oxidoreductase
LTSGWDVVVVGAGPAGLAVAIGAALRGLSTVVLERHTALPDKACGEGLMPPAVHALEALGVLDHVPRAARSPIEGIRYVQEDGSTCQGRLPGAGGLALRRTALIQALGERARAVGVELRLGEGVRHHARTAASVVVHTDHATYAGELLVAADGLASPIRRAEGLDLGLPARRRFGLRQHFARDPWTPFVEVHLSRGAEAYVTPTGPHEVGLALLWEEGAPLTAPHLDARLLEARFPQLAAALAGATPTSSPRGAGPLARGAHRVVAERLALVGDAAGYVDAITGEGLSLSLVSAAALVGCLPEALRRRGAPHALAPYEETFARLFRRYAWSTGALLALARHPALRRPLLRALARRPRLFEATLAWVVG